jgi:hypothetical protein
MKLKRRLDWGNSWRKKKSKKIALTKRLGNRDGNARRKDWKGCGEKKKKDRAGRAVLLWPGRVAGAGKSG